MGAKNVAAAYQRWAGRVPAMSMQILVYMAVVSKDSDDWPWYGQGQASLAEFALGRENPDRSDLRAVQRAMTPLLDAGAITVDRSGAARADGNTTARYRLNLTERSNAARSKWSETPDGNRRILKADASRRHPTKSGHDTRRFLTQHPTVSDATPDGNRRTKEKEKIKRSEKTEEERAGVRTDVTLTRAKAGGQTADILEIFPGASREPPHQPPPRRSSRAADAIAEASARCRAAEAAHRAAKEAN